MIDPDKLMIARERFQRDRTAWMATTRPDGRPHVAPMWFVWLDDRAYVMTAGVKLANVEHNGYAALNTESGLDVVIVEGTARVIPETDERFQAAAAKFLSIYKWDITNLSGNESNNKLIEITPTKVLAWKT
jgi:nitroimidazol reductase NimA-like FMN-containing flavoprotein (pyridoxamine 5'-phosphate oxidase superfamily)